MNALSNRFSEPLSRFQLWLLRWLIGKVVYQGQHHGDRIIALYRLIGERAQEVFYEDYVFTLNEYLGECFHNAQLAPPTGIVSQTDGAAP